MVINGELVGRVTPGRFDETMDRLDGGRR
jgi:hypothetical protein